MYQPLPCGLLPALPSTSLPTGAPQVMGTLKELCSDGHTVLVSIHQPRSSVFAMFDDLILMAGEGRGGAGRGGAG